jgi:hypothetical protein
MEFLCRFFRVDFSQKYLLLISNSVIDSYREMIMKMIMNI